MRVALHDGWTVRAVGGDVPEHIAGVTIPATVPGCVHLDLMAAGLLPDPYLDENESAVAWVGRVDWRYETTVEWPGAGPGEQVDLVALGLDTVATVELNGQPLGRTENMHRSYRFPLAGVARPGANRLAVTFAAPVTEARRREDALGPRPFANTHPYNALRKMACAYGWDWGPDLPTSGIWRPLYRHAWRGARIDSVRPLVTLDGGVGVLRAHVAVARADDRALTVEVEVAGVRARGPVDRETSTVEVRVPDARLWWPVGYGGQPLYEVTARLADADGELDSWSGRIGFRTVTLDTTPDATGTPFTLSVNGTAVFARGVNWIPGDCFPARVTRERYEPLLRETRAAGVNLVRVWGGGIYESDDFYDLCDELGLLVWQDFLFACAAYAEEQPLRGEVVAEAREAVTRLARHPSLALWNGNNENIWGYWDWGWRAPLAGRTWGSGYYHEVLPAIVAELDPTRPYSPGSPYSFDPDTHPNDPAHGTMHVWDVWNELDYTEYRRYAPRFVSEFGFQGPPTWATLTRAVHDEPMTPDSPGIRRHQKAADGNGKLARGLAAHLPEPDTFADWHWATSLNQARAVAFGIEHFRSLSPHCMGAIVWQINDVWPVISWAAIDGDGRRKPLWYALRRSFRDRLLTIQPRASADGGPGLALIAVNDCGQPWSQPVTVTRRDRSGAVRSSLTVHIDLSARATGSYPLPADLATPGDPGEVLVADADGNRAWWHFAEDVAGTLPEPRLDARCAAVANGYLLTVTAGGLVRDLTVLADRVAPDATVDAALVSLLPGETATFFVGTTAQVSPEAFLDPSVLRSANQLVAAPARS